MTKSKKITIAIIVSVLVVALITTLTIFSLNKPKKPIKPVVATSSENTSSEEVKAEPIEVPKIEPVTTDKKDKEVTSKNDEPVKVDVTKNVDKEKAKEWKETEFKKTMYTKDVCNARNKPIKGSAVIKKYNANVEVKVVAKTDTEYYKLSDNSYIHQNFLTQTKQQQAEKPKQTTTMPQPNEKYAKTPNRNMPSFTVNTSVVGPNGTHGEKKMVEILNGELQKIGEELCYYHAGVDEWLNAEFWFVYRYGQHPEATDYLPYSPQVSPYQQDGDYNPFSHRGDYYCKACNKWVDGAFWEDGRHGSGTNHLSNLNK